MNPSFTRVFLEPTLSFDRTHQPVPRNSYYKPLFVMTVSSPTWPAFPNEALSLSVSVKISISKLVQNLFDCYSRSIAPGPKKKHPQILQCLTNTLHNLRERRFPVRCLGDTICVIVSWPSLICFEAGIQNSFAPINPVWHAAFNIILLFAKFSARVSPYDFERDNPMCQVPATYFCRSVLQPVLSFDTPRLPAKSASSLWSV